MRFLDTNVLLYSTSSVAEISPELVMVRGAGTAEVTDDRLSVELDDGRTISVPLELATLVGNTGWIGEPSGLLDADRQKPASGNIPVHRAELRALRHAHSRAHH